ncbi:hypothetical protein PsorP6_016867 [Peronosclerospora sorghi]|uniref:Uncharacterized protein n=1 Tax=Peronosclerospora sorghi TaxID=230839 RepID=A0ACC0WCQ1_9STRA|nr:hypothetical protein PsorP6_016867 [Peronosclerospora sorghi]
MLTKLADIMEERETRAAEEATATRAASTDMHGMVDEDGRDAGREAREMEQSFASKELGETEAARQEWMWISVNQDSKDCIQNAHLARVVPRHGAHR